MINTDESVASNMMTEVCLCVCAWKTEREYDKACLRHFWEKK